ncbi:PIN domain-containing protein [Candidatus Micrarchaeota archaeon]|nr:PIN domain-containing protein [Candidatus Micrarchaeota archaeon]
MQFVVDTNVLISALLAQSKTYELLALNSLELFVPEHSLVEIHRNKKELQKKMGVTDEEFELALNLILSHVTVITRKHYVKFKGKAKKISPDFKDFPFFALALAKKIPLWTNEVRLKQQKEVIVYNTKDIVRLLCR